MPKHKKMNSSQVKKYWFPRSRTRRPIPHIHATCEKEFPNHPLTEEENKEYEFAICFHRDVLGYPLRPGTVHTPSQKRSIIEMVESIVTDLGFDSDEQ